MKISNWFGVPFVILVLTLVAVYPIRLNKNDAIDIKAETSGSSPESGATSKLKEAYDFLISKGTNYGDSQSPDWVYTSHGTYWDTILFSAFWEPNGTATEEDVVEGVTFYSGSNNRVIRTGTAKVGTNPGAYYEQFVHYDDISASDTQEEESTWINTNSSAGNQVWYDTRTGLYWARSQPTTLTNTFSSPATGFCEFFNTGTYPTRGDYGNSGTDPDCGNAINACADLSLSSNEGQPADTDWYLPTQKEAIGAMIDGMYNQTTFGLVYTTTSTESALNSLKAWNVYIYSGGIDTSTPNKTQLVRATCVRRD